MMRKIIHIDMDAFFASVEQRDNPVGKVTAEKMRKIGIKNGAEETFKSLRTGFRRYPIGIKFIALKD